MLLDRVIHFRKNLGDQGKCRSPKKLKSLLEVPYVALLKEQVLSFKTNLFSAPLRVPRPSYPFRENFGRSRKVLFAEKAKIVDRGSICSAPEVQALSFNVNLIFSL